MSTMTLKDVVDRLRMGADYTGHEITDSECEEMADALDALLRERESAKESDDELPGMWSAADFIGGDPDERSYAERESAQKLVTDEIVEHVQYSLDNHPDNRTYAEQVSAASVRAALEAVLPMLASARVPDERKAVMYADESRQDQYEAAIYDKGWNDCRKAMLAAAPKPEL